MIDEREVEERRGRGGWADFVVVEQAHLCQEDKDTSRVNPCVCVLCMDNEKGIKA